MIFSSKLSSSSTASTSTWTSFSPLCLLVCQSRHASTKVQFASCRKMEFFQARQHGFASRLSVSAPFAAAEWDFDKNPSKIFPAIISTASMQPYWWKCKACGHSYCMSPEAKTIRGRKCPNCVGGGGEKNKKVETTNRILDKQEEEEPKSSLKKKKNLNKKKPSLLKLKRERKISVSYEEEKKKENDDSVLPGEVDPKLKPFGSGKAIMRN